MLVTGGKGFLGGHVVTALRANEHEVIDPSHEALNLCDMGAVQKFVSDTLPEAVVHLAACCGGIGINQQLPATFWSDNLLMGLNVLWSCGLGGQQLVMVGTTCSYPSECPVPFKEADIWNGYPEPTNAPYGIAKRSLLAGFQAYRSEFGLRGCYLIPANLYGPGDHYEPNRSHVIPALIRTFTQAKADGAATVVLWGTGGPTRDFLFVRDAADAIVRAIDCDQHEPINVGTGREISIAVLARHIARATGYKGDIVWDASKPDGQMRRCLDTARAKNVLDWTATTTFEEGLRETIKDYSP